MISNLIRSCMSFELSNKTTTFKLPDEKAQKYTSLGKFIFNIMWFLHQ